MAKYRSSSIEYTLKTLTLFGYQPPKIHKDDYIVAMFPTLKTLMNTLYLKVLDWNEAKMDARNNPETNHKKSGRLRADIKIILACYILRRCLGFSDKKIITEIYDNKFIKAYLSALVEVSINENNLPKYSTFKKYMSMWSHDEVLQ